MAIPAQISSRFSDTVVAVGVRQELNPGRRAVNALAIAGAYLVVLRLGWSWADSSPSRAEFFVTLGWPVVLFAFLGLGFLARRRWVDRPGR
jgi:hypothetical protein